MGIVQHIYSSKIHACLTQKMAFGVIRKKKHPEEAIFLV
jgi:hypothetical protein